MDDKSYNLFKNWVDENKSIDLIALYSFNNEQINVKIYFDDNKLSKLDNKKYIEMISKKIKKHNRDLKFKLVFENEKWTIDIPYIPYQSSEELNSFLTDSDIKYKKNTFKYIAKTETN